MRDFFSRRNADHASSSWGLRANRRCGTRMAGSRWVEIDRERQVDANREGRKLPKSYPPRIRSGFPPSPEPDGTWRDQKPQTFNPTLGWWSFDSCVTLLPCISPALWLKFCTHTDWHPREFRSWLNRCPPIISHAATRKKSQLSRTNPQQLASHAHMLEISQSIDITSRHK